MQHLIDADHQNILPSHGEALLFPDFFSPQESDLYFGYFENDVSWVQQPALWFRKKMMQQCLTAFFGEQDMEYVSAGLTMKATNWTSPLLHIKEKLEAKFEASFNTCLLNYYRDGRDYMNWHRDHEHELGAYPVIVSVSFGSTRIFQFRDYKEKIPVVSLELDHGSALLMKMQTQEHWEHRVPKTTTLVGPRINLTFKLILKKE